MPLFDATFTPPPALEGLTVSAESGAAIHLEWLPSTLAAGDFRGYRIYRSLTGGADYRLVQTIADQGTTAWDDYSAPNGVPVYYRVTQVNLDGYEAAPAEAVAESSGCDWWLVTPGDPSASFEVPNATAYQGAWPIQTEAHEPIGRPFKLVESGTILGEELQLTAYLEPADAGLVPRIRALAATPGILLKSPHGEVYEVALTALTRQRRTEGAQEIRLAAVQVGAPG